MNTMPSHCKTHLPNSNPPPKNPPISLPKHRQFLDVSLLKRSSHLREFQQIHNLILKNPSDQVPMALAKLIESLVGSSHMDYARKVFEQMPDPSTFVFNAMIRGYALTCSSQEGISVYIQMTNCGVKPDNFTYPFLLKACTSLSQGKGVHSLILKSQGLGLDVYSQTSLVSFYSSLGDLECARKAFDKMPERNVVSWTAMITGYVKQKRFNAGLALFRLMQVSAINPNEMTLVNVLSACANLGAFEMGDWVYRYIEKNRLSVNPTLGAAIVDMYMKCGHIHRASQVFERLPERNVFSWNAIIGGLAMSGCGEEALERFSEMIDCKIKPDDVTFIGVLSACAHSGLVEKGKDYFHSMSRDYRIEPNIKHYGCLVDLLGRAGLLDEIYEVVKNMPMEPNGVLWGTLLNSCSVHGNIELAEVAMERLVELEPFNDGNYVIMSNMYASKGRWEDVAKVRRFMREKGILKNPGCSSIEVGNEVHEFLVGDCSMTCNAVEGSA